MPRLITLAVDLDILLSCCPAADQPAALPCPEPSFTFSVRQPVPQTSAVPPSNSLQGALCTLATGASSTTSPTSGPSPGSGPACTSEAAAGVPRTQLAWLRPGVRRFLLAVQTHVITVLLVRRHCFGERRCCGTTNSGYVGASRCGGSDRGGRWEDEVGGCTGALLSIALPSIDPDGQFFGQRIVLVQDRLRGRSARPRTAGAAVPSSQAPDGAAFATWAAAPTGASAASTGCSFPARTLCDLGPLSSPMPDGSPGLLVATTADRAVFGPLAEHVIECQPYKKEYGKYDDVLDCLASVVSEPLLGVSVPQALRRLGLSNGKLQPSPLMQAIHAQSVLRLAQRLQGGGAQSQEGGTAAAAVAGGRPAAAAIAGFVGQQSKGTLVPELIPQQQGQQQGATQLEPDRSFKALQRLLWRQKQKQPVALPHPQAPRTPPSQGPRRQPSRNTSKATSAIHRQSTEAVNGDVARGGGSGGGNVADGGRNRRRQPAPSQEPLPSIPEVPFMELGEPCDTQPLASPAPTSTGSNPLPSRVTPAAVQLVPPSPQPQSPAPASPPVVVPRVSPLAGSGSISGKRRTAWESESLSSESGSFMASVLPSAAGAMLQHLAGSSGAAPGDSADPWVSQLPQPCASNSELVRQPKSFPAAANPSVTRHISGCREDHATGEASRGTRGTAEDLQPSSPLTSAASAVAAATTKLLSRILGGHRRGRCRPSDTGNSSTDGDGAADCGAPTARCGSRDLESTDTFIRQGVVAAGPAAVASMEEPLDGSSPVLLHSACAAGALAPRQPSITACSTPAVPLLPEAAHGRAAAGDPRSHGMMHRQASCRTSVPGAVGLVEDPGGASGAGGGKRHLAVAELLGQSGAGAGGISVSPEPAVPQCIRAQVSAPSGLSCTAPEGQNVSKEEVRDHAQRLLHDIQVGAVPGAAGVSVRQSTRVEQENVGGLLCSSSVTLASRGCGGSFTAAAEGFAPAASPADPGACSTASAMWGEGLRPHAVGVSTGMPADAPAAR